MMADKGCKKILFVIPTLGGGGGKVLLYILKYLDRERFIPHLAVFKNNGEYQDEVPRDVAVYNMNKTRRDFLRLIFMLAYRVLPEIKPDVVVSFYPYTNTLVLLSRKFSLTKPAVVITEHNYTPIEQEHVRMARIRKILIKISYPRAERIIAVSTGVKDGLIKFFGVPEEKIKVIYNGIDYSSISLLKDFVGDIRWFKDGIPTITACGRLVRQKNYPLLFEAFARVLKVCNARLLILGDGEERNSLEELACRLGVKESIIFLGFQKNPFNFIARSHIFVLSSGWEGFGNVIVEAMACGVPVISTRCLSGPDEIIADGVNGILVPVGDRDAMALAILRLLNDEPLRRRLVEAGRKRAEDFCVKKMVAEYQKVFGEIEASDNADTV